MFAKSKKECLVLVWMLIFMEVLEKATCQDSDPEIQINIADINAAGEEAITDVQKIDELESELVRRGVVLQRRSPSSFHQALFRGNPQQLAETRRSGLIETQTAVNLVRRLEDKGILGRDLINRVPLNHTVIADVCPKPPRCLETRYRSIDGSCNNRDNLSWGKSFTALRRLLPPEYADGLNMPRTFGEERRALPSARLVSSTVCSDTNAPSTRVSLHVMQWGQFLDHDITNTALTRGSDGAGITCCDERVLQNRSLLHPECFAIDIPENDGFFSEFDLRCMEFIRSQAAPRDECVLGPRQQLNMLTAFIDGSMIYGSTLNESLNLRSFKAGKLKSSTRGETLLPPDESGACISLEDEPPCVIAGDTRVNEQTLLTVYHQLWFREHNRIAGILSRLNPGWNDEALYEESRRIVGAMIQHITYNEFLPILLGPRLMGQNQLNVQWNGFSEEYDPKVNPTLSNVFATAAYRLGHTMVEGTLRLFSGNREDDETVELRTQFFHPVMIYDENSYDKLLGGLSVTPSQNFDSYVTKELTHHLFEPPGLGFGLDLIALNIQRGRDHGLPGYNKWREFCGLPKAESFEQLASYINPTVADELSKLYGSVDDVDLFIAGISEPPVEREAILGPTFGCLVAEQFKRLKVGDRFWYENGKMEPSFTEDQLNEIRKVTLARVLCDNSNLQSVPRNAFLLESRRNRLEGCIQGTIPRMDLEPWINEPVWG